MNACDMQATVGARGEVVGAHSLALVQPARLRSLMWSDGGRGSCVAKRGEAWGVIKGVGEQQCVLAALGFSPTSLGTWGQDAM